MHFFPGLCSSTSLPLRFGLTAHSSYNVTPEELFDLFGKFGPVRYVVGHNRTKTASRAHGPGESGIDKSGRQIRQGIANNTKGTAFVVYEDVMDAKQACDKLNGFNFQNRYLVGLWQSVYYVGISLASIQLKCLTVLYHQPEKMAKSKEDLAERQENLERLKKQHGIE